MEFIKKLASRKLLAMLLGIIVTSFHLPIDAGLQMKLVELIMMYIGSQGIVDAAGALKK